MSQDIIVVTTAYGAHTVTQLGGQQILLDTIKASGADGVEIRQELLLETDQLEKISNAIENKKLISVYSVPDTLFHSGTPIATYLLERYLKEADQLKARLLKLSLGDMPTNYDLSEIIKVLNSYEVQLVIENDQTKVGGHIEPLKRFFADVAAKKCQSKWHSTWRTGSGEMKIHLKPQTIFHLLLLTSMSKLAS